ncbi:MAG: carboxymuconolactone decarboxylase family protein [Xanthomonadaceae bacterium]|nr:carboxymuconolactone decarboxylase family protein [Xanthomonadaceae bacterium]
MSDFPSHTLDTAPAAARPDLEGAQQQYGMIPNMYARMAEAPTLLQAYLQTSETFANSSLDTVQQQVVLLTVSRINGCGYCMGAHSVLADMAGVPAEVTDAIRNDTPIGDARLEALRQFTRQMVEQRGWVGDEVVQTFLAAGHSPANVLDVVLGIGLKTMSNYANHLVGTELDEAFAGRAWQAPA